MCGAEYGKKEEARLIGLQTEIVFLFSFLLMSLDNINPFLLNSGEKDNGSEIERLLKQTCHCSV